MALTKITKSGITNSAVDNNKIEADAVDATKIADNAISEEHLDTTVFTGNTELSANAASDDILLIYDASAGTIKKINAGNVGLQAPTISSVSPTNLISGDGTGNYTITITGTGYTADVTAKLVKQGGSDLAFDTVTRNSSTQLTCVIAKSSILNADEPFDVVVTTAGALNATNTDAITVDASPAFVTASGSLGSGNGGASLSFSVNATDPDSAGNVTFELQSGSLPPGLSLTNTAAEGGTAIISGTATNPVANTTYNFTLRAVDAASNTTSRSFSITINRIFTSESFTSTGTFSVPVGVTSLSEVLVVAGGGPGASQHGSTGVGGGGAGGLIFMPEYPVTPGGTITVTVGEGGPSHAGPAVPQGPKGQPSSFGSPGDPGLAAGGVLLAQGGGHGNEGVDIPFPGCVNGGSGGGGGFGRGGGEGTQPTQPGNSGAYGFGNCGGSGGFAGGGLSGGGGGGGAGANGGPSGATGDANGGGPGGNGRAYTIADGTTPVYYAGGGGGSAAPGAPAPGGTGGQGGGTAGSRCSPSQNAGANKGGGSGGVRSGYTAGAGGKGVVIVRY